VLSWPPVISCVFVLVEFCPEVQISRLCNENLGAELLTLQRTQKEKGVAVKNARKMYKFLGK
jgi:hypothetical protein